MLFVAGLTLCFGGGVLLATVLLHMLKEVREVLEGAFAKGALPESLEEYPFAELMVGAGKPSSFLCKVPAGSQFSSQIPSFVDLTFC